jgi:hypothetical protein
MKQNHFHDCEGMNENLPTESARHAFIGRHGAALNRCPSRCACGARSADERVYFFAALRRSAQYFRIRLETAFRAAADIVRRRPPRLD